TLRVTEREHQLYSQELHQGVTSPASMVDFMIDPVTYLPLHYVQYRREGEEWKATNTIDFEFNLDLPREMFTPASLRKRYASWEPQPTP
ncbi:MAG: hypothetical protein ACAH95_12355, partial [Fimbriimonas sp.]